MAVYTNHLTATALTLFPGYITHAWPVVCSSLTIATPIVYSATASKQGMIKDYMKTIAATPLLNCAGTSGVNKHKYTGGTAASWYPLCSLAKPTAYTKATKVSGGTMYVTASSSFVSGRFWMDAYSSGGVRQASAGGVIVASPTTGTAAMNAVIPTTASVTVPVGGFLVARVSCMGGTARLYMGAASAGAPVGATRAFYWNPTEVAAVTGASVENRERFQTSKGVAYPDGTKVYEYDASTMAATGSVAVIGGAAVGSGAAEVGVVPAATGVGEVVFTRAFADTAEYFYIIPDPASGNVWATVTPTLLGHRINPVPLAKLIAECTTAGTTAVTEPAWSTLALVDGSTVVDGTVTWTMAAVETLCTNAVQGYQLGHWTTLMTAAIAVVGPPAVAATRIAPASPGNYALCTVAGTAGAVIPVWPTTVVSGVTTVVDGTVTWTLYNNAVYD